MGYKENFHDSSKITKHLTYELSKLRFFNLNTFSIHFILKLR